VAADERPASSKAAREAATTPGVSQEPAAVDAEPPRRLVDGSPDQLVDRPVAPVARGGRIGRS